MAEKRSGNSRRCHLTAADLHRPKQRPKSALIVLLHCLVTVRNLGVQDDLHHLITSF